MVNLDERRKREALLDFDTREQVQTLRRELEELLLWRNEVLTEKEDSAKGFSDQLKGIEKNLNDKMNAVAVLLMPLPLFEQPKTEMPDDTELHIHYSNEIGKDKPELNIHVSSPTKKPKAKSVKKPTKPKNKKGVSGGKSKP